MIADKKWPTKYGNAIEKFLTCQVLHMLQIAHMVPDVIGKMTSIHKFKNVHTKNIERPDKIV